MAQRAVGSHISLLSNSEIRYDGFLHSIDPNNNTISLVNVHILGTEGRKNGVDEVPPSDQLFEYIVFSGGDIQNITLYEEQAPASADPAIVSAGPARTVTGGAAAVTAAGSPPAAATAVHHIKADEPGGKINLNSVARTNDAAEGHTSANSTKHDDRHHNGAPSGRARRGGMTGGSHRSNSRYENNNTNSNNSHTNYHGSGSNRRDNGARNSSHGGGGASAGARYNRGGGGGGGGYSGRGGAAAIGSHYRRRQEGHTGQDFQPATGAQKEEFKEDFDFKRSQAELDAKRNEFEKAKEDAKTYTKVYNKSSFFDNINNDQKERGQNSRVDRDEVKRADAETFGQEMVGAMRGFRRGRGGRGRYNRY